MLQQNLYNENNRYVKWLLKNNKLFFDLDILLLLICIIGYFVVFNSDGFSILLLIVMSIISLVMAIIWKNRIKNDQNKKPLVVTPRVKRMIVTNSIIHIIPLVLLFVNFNNKNVWLMLLIYCLILYLNFVFVLIP